MESAIIEFKTRLILLGACEDARIWADGKTAKEAWNECERGDWLLWWAQKEGQEIRSLTLAKARCAKLVIHLMKDKRSIDAVNVAERFGLGEANEQELNTAAAAAAAAGAAYAAYAAYAAAAYAAYAAAYAAADAAAAADDADDAVRKETLLKCAEIVRENIKPTFI